MSTEFYKCGPFDSGSIDNSEWTESEWTDISLPIVREAFAEGLAKKLLSVQPMTEDDYLEGKEKRQYPNKYDDFIDIQSLKWYIIDEIERQDLMVSTLRTAWMVSWPLNLKDRDFKYIDDVGFLNIVCYSEDLEKRDNCGGGCLCGGRRDYNELRISLNPQRWNAIEINKMIEEIKED